MSSEQTGRNLRGVSTSTTTTVRPQPVSDKSYVESVVDFFHDVVPQAVAGQNKPDEYDHIAWVKLEELNTGSNFNTHEESCLLFVIVGYTNGYQIWQVKLNGDADELVSLRQGPVKVVNILQSPLQGKDDMFCDKRPLVAVCDAASSSCPFSTVKIWSLSSGEEFKTIDFKSEVYDILSNRRVMIVCLQEKIAVLDAHSLSKKFGITNCFPAPGPNVNPVALSSRWLAFADRKFYPMYQSRGGVSADKLKSYTSAVFNAAKTFTKGLSLVGETVGRWTGSNPVENSDPLQGNNPSKYVGLTPGIVTIIDVENHGENEKDEELREKSMAHFVAHESEPVTALAFDATGSLLFTADTFGQNFHIFHVLPHPTCPSLASIHHLYILHRGDTMATVCHVSFAYDSRWVVVTTRRGTSHVFPITSYGGAVCLRTHSSGRVVNRSSRFHTSAGLEDLSRTCPTVLVQPGGSPTSNPLGPMTSAKDCLLVGKNGLVNPRMPPLPHPEHVTPYIQIKMGTSSRANASSGSTGNSPTNVNKANRLFSVESVGGASIFAASRAWIAGNASQKSRLDPPGTCPVDPLFIISNYGNLVEYNIDIQPLKNSPQSEDMPFEAIAQAKGQWPIFRLGNAPESKALLSNDNILCKSMSNMNRPKKSTEDITNATIAESCHSSSSQDEHWLANIEIETHAPPHRRLWMGPQFAFKTFQPPGSVTMLSSNNTSTHTYSATISAQRQDEDTLDQFTEELDLQSLRIQPVRSDPLPTPKSRYFVASPQMNYGENALIIDNGPESYTDIYGSWPNDVTGCLEESDQLIETLADAMNENLCTPVDDEGAVDENHICLFPPHSPNDLSPCLSPEWT